MDGDFSMRPLQKRIADYMVDVEREDNVVLQLNMGEGKSSVIIPMVSSTLANGQQLARVTVLKPLAAQMFNLLRKRLSGLANRRIFYFPFSRRIAITPEKARTIRHLFELCTVEGGILVTQPEHILSYKLMGIDMSLRPFVPDASAIASTLVSTQGWLDRHSKDVLDESDEILHVKYQLVYAAGQQVSPEGHPDRWTTMQQVFRLLRIHASSIRDTHPDGIEILHRDFAGSFPIIRVLDCIAGQALTDRVAVEILQGNLANLTFGQLPSETQQALFSYISRLNPATRDVTNVDSACCHGSLWKGVLLLRGILAHGILVHSLKDRRWRVDYGLHSVRTMLAVPYRAKDVPSTNAEFGHPDVMIALTCLSYYYGGLSTEQLDLCFQTLFKLDNPAMEYQKWVDDAGNVPMSLRNIGGVNIEDSDQLRTRLIPLFSFNMAVIDFFLTHIIFPKSAKEFTARLATSAWDLASHKNNATIGFSGTNDNQYLLPTTIHQRDPVEQTGTNAAVLSYILQPENDFFHCCQDGDGRALGAKDFIHLLASQRPEIHVLLDVGALMIEMTNVELANYWLSLKSEMAAVVFFTDDDELAIVTRDGTIEPFVTSSFNQRLDRCLVYLDDAHTRGTDLKLPIQYRAAVTLGPKLTKDRLLQGL